MEGENLNGVTGIEYEECTPWLGGNFLTLFVIISGVVCGIAIVITMCTANHLVAEEWIAY